MPIYCPRCGQQRLSPDVRFCSRCGLRLEGIEQLVASGGLTPTPDDATPACLWTRQRARPAIQVLFAIVVLLPVAFTISIIADSAIPLLMFGMLCLLGVARMAYARIVESDVALPGGQRHALAASHGLAGLLPSRPWRSVVAGQRLTTGELEPPPSVTEHTTNLLDR